MFRRSLAGSHLHHTEYTDAARMNAASIPTGSSRTTTGTTPSPELKPAPSFFELLMSQTLQQPQASPKGFRHVAVFKICLLILLLELALNTSTSQVELQPAACSSHRFCAIPLPLCSCDGKPPAGPLFVLTRPQSRRKIIQPCLIFS